MSVLPKTSAFNAFLAAASIVAPLIFTVPALAEGENPSHSTKESAKRGLLIKKVFPMPDVFNWNNHEVAFKESWMEKNPSGHYNLLCFQLIVNNSATEELALQSKTNKSMEFREEGNKGKTLIIGTTVFYPFRSFKRIGRGRGLGEVIHYVEIKDPRTRKVSFRIHTMDHETDTSKPTDLVIVFDELR